MTIPEIRETCLKASQVYYEHLDRNNKGVYNIIIRSIEKVKDDKFKLKINSKIFDEETLVFKHLSTGNEWSIENIKIQVYDRDTNTLVIKPKPEVYKIMTISSENDWLIVSDLKFLIERVKQWYTLNGSDLRIPVKKSKIEVPKSDIFFGDEVPSEEQIKALESIFENPLSYVWGAPGTGKTQFVLSYAVLHYLANKKKVAIVAPTNHALEQIYRGVIKMTDKAGIKRNKILRLGGPSKKFADEFPEVCEIIGLENQLKQLNSQVKILEGILGIDESSIQERELESALSLCKEKEKLQVKFNEIEGHYKKLLTSIDDINIKHRGKELKIRNLIKEQELLRKKRDSTFYKATKVFRKKRNFIREIDALSWEEATVEVDLKKIQLEKDQLVNKTNDNRKSHNSIMDKVELLVKTLKGILEKTEIEIGDFFTAPNFERIKTEVTKEIEKIRNNRPVVETIAEEYKHLDELSLKANYNKLKAERDKLLNYSTEQRLKNVSIVGATLDTYLYRFKEEKLNVDHIFLDEAGYSNIIKALTLFNQNVPITFLGDHMQLPPVCEISKQDIQNNQEFRPVMVWDQSAIYLEDLFQQQDLNAIVHRYLNNNPANFSLLRKSNLTGTFRFGKSLAHVLQKFVYTEGFHSKSPDETDIIIYNVKNPPNQRFGDRRNQAEVNAIINLVTSNFTPEDSVAVLAPYTAQVRAIGNELPAYLQNNKVLTVHKSQGQEWDTVIYSVCDIGNGKRPWFTDSLNELSNGKNNINTAISRAKKQLIMVCDQEEWSKYKGQLITGILEAAGKPV